MITYVIARSPQGDEAIFNTATGIASRTVLTYGVRKDSQ